MRGLIKFVDIPDITLLNSRQGNLREDLANNLFKEKGYFNIGSYLLDLVNNDAYNTIVADYDVIKHMETGSRIFLSSIYQDWYDNTILIDNWFKAESAEFYQLDLDCQVSYKSITGNYFVLNLTVIDIGNLLSTL